MQRAQLAMLPAGDGRRAERRVVNLAAGLRESGAAVIDVEVLNLSTDGYMAQLDVPVEIGQVVYLKLPGMMANKSRVIWAEAGKAGFEFSSPLHRAVIDQLAANERKPIRRGHFGPQRV